MDDLLCRFAYRPTTPDQADQPEFQNVCALRRPQTSPERWLRNEVDGPRLGRVEPPINTRSGGMSGEMSDEYCARAFDLTAWIDPT
jgi:hypothetical protein